MNDDARVKATTSGHPSVAAGDQSMPNAARLSAYQVCQQRGHQSDYSVSYAVNWSPTKNHCRFCGTWFWSETVEHEEGAPEETS